MTSAYTVNLEEAMCCSPESGFGSEIHYSPTSASADSSLSVQSSKLFLPKKLETQFNPNLQDCEQPLIKIVNVKSLAKNNSINSLKSNTCSFGVVHGSKRLRLQKSNQKYILVLDSKVIETSQKPVSCEFIESPIKKALKLSFSGLPVIAKRDNFDLSPTWRNEFVMGLFSKEDQNRVSVKSSTSDSSLSCKNECITTLFSKENQTNSSDNPFLIPVNAQITDISNTSTPVLPFSQSNSIVSSIPRLTVFNMHTQSTTRLSSNDLHSSSALTLKTYETKSCESKKRKSESQSSSNSKAEKIRRLKEIMQQKEKDLQKVRKTFGYIS